MRSFSAVLAILPVAFAAPILEARSGVELIPNQWIFKLRDDAHDNLLSTTMNTVVKSLGIEPLHVYNYGSFKGFTITGAESLIRALPFLTSVHAIEQDYKVNASTLTSQSGAPYGLGRISHQQKGSTTYVYDDSAGAGTYSYIIDTGIYTQHNDFEGRATFGANFAGDGLNADGNGHGTHVAGTTGSKTYGLAKKTNLIAVKVLNSNGQGSNSGVIAGIQYAVKDAKDKGRIGKAVANMSLGGAYSSMVNSAVAAAVQSGLFMAVAAGNDGVDAKNTSPASESSACTIGATDSNDNRASFSNYGSYVDVFAPGVGILSTWNRSPSDTNTISGTSMATPHITGLGAYLLGLEGPRSATALCQRIIDLSTKSVTVNAGSGSPNRLAYNGDGQ
ncbi:subtilisin-like protein [Acrodontium crateriforme]|uniref:Subtilisin-like protein n=1 Tax=Acrodontium crateriforme TaxID=150365 RepID=A0AAQ3M3K1_9PEZI|nr:subtilisin-like protein [Acrodontium crateriforme]